MSAWVATGIAAAALAYTILASWFERRQRRNEFALMRREADSAEEERLERRRAYISVEPGERRGGGHADSHDFKVTNAGPSLARHLALRVDRSDETTLVGPMKVDPHILQQGETGFATVSVPRSERLSDLVVVVEWVDAEQGAEWTAHQQRKERVVGPLEPVTRNP